LIILNKFLEISSYLTNQWRHWYFRESTKERPTTCWCTPTWPCWTTRAAKTNSEIFFIHKIWPAQKRLFRTTRWESFLFGTLSLILVRRQASWVLHLRAKSPQSLPSALATIMPGWLEIIEISFVPHFKAVVLELGVATLVRVPKV
jgi:hypothetical protein